VDFSNLYYKTVNNKKKCENYHLVVIFNFVAHILRLGMIPIFVFDGKPPLSKDIVIAQRKARVMRRAIAASIASAPPAPPSSPQSPKLMQVFGQIAAMMSRGASPMIDEMISRFGCGSRAGNKSNSVSPMRQESPVPASASASAHSPMQMAAPSPIQMACMAPPPMAVKPVPVVDVVMRENINDIKKMLDYLKIPHVSIANGEADPVCAKIMADYKGAIRFVLSDDVDLLALGCPVLRNFNFAKNTAEYLHPDRIREHLGLSQEQMIDLFIMFSTEYRPIFAKYTKLEILEYLKILGTLEAVAQRIAIIFPNVQIPDAAEIAERRAAFDVSQVQYASEIRHFEHISKFVNGTMNPPMSVLQKHMEKTCPSLSPHLVKLKLQDIYYVHGD
jgi:hypothetical protein